MEPDKKVDKKMRLTIPSKSNFRDIGKSYALLTSPKSDKTVNVRLVYLDVIADFMQFLFEQILLGHMVTLPLRCGTMAIQGHIVSMEDMGENGEYIGYKRDGKPRFGMDMAAMSRVQPRPSDARLWATMPKREPIYNMLEKTGGVRYRVVWKRWKSKIKHGLLYKFVPCRDNMNIIREVAKEGQTYTIVNPDQNVHCNPLSYDSLSYFLYNNH